MTDEVEKCLHCGMTREEFLQSNEVGCAYCYEAFVWDVRAALRENNENPEHVGNTPEKITDFDDDREVQYRNLDDAPQINPENYVVEKDISVAENIPNEKNEKRDLRKELTGQLQEALENEEYEKAAKIRDMIKNLPEQ